MKLVNREGNLPKVLKPFLTHILTGENKNSDVYECTYDEIVNKAKEEKLEAQVIIDKKNTGNAYLCAVGASIRTSFLYNIKPSVKPVLYFSKLDEVRKKEFQYELRKAREHVIIEHKKQIENSKLQKIQNKEYIQQNKDSIIKNVKARSNKQSR